MTVPPPRTPCIGLCRLQDGQCVGCARTLDEIQAWRTYTPQERNVLMDEVLPRRVIEIKATLEEDPSLA